MPEQWLAGECLNQDGECVVALAHVRGIDLTGVTGEHHLGAFTNASEDRFQCGRLEVLGFIDDHELALQRSSAQEGDGLERQLSAIRQVFNQAASIATGALLGECDDCVVDRRHPRIELFFQTARQESHVRATHGHQRSVHRESLVSTLLHYLFQSGGDGHHRLAGARPTVEGDNGDVRVEQQLNGKALLFVAGAQSPCFGVVGIQQVQRIFTHAGQCRLRAVAQDRKVVVVEQPGTLDIAQVGAAVRIQRIHGLRGGLQRYPAHGLVGGRARERMVLACSQPEVGGFDAKSSIVRHQAGGGDLGLADGRTNDSIVRHVGVEPVVLEPLAIDVVHLDVQGGGIGVVRKGGGFGQ